MRTLTSALLAAILLLPVPAWAARYVMPRAAKAAHYIMYVGSYTAGTSKGIYAWRFDSRDGHIAPLGLMAETPQPAHLWIAPNGKTLYAVNWETVGGVSAYRIDPKTGALTFLNKTSSHGAQPNQ